MTQTAADSIDKRAAHTYFAEILDDPGKSVMIDMMSEDPHFWSTAASWITAANTYKTDDPLYAMDKTRMSTLMSLMTARPNNPECEAMYDCYANTLHDLVVYGMNVALNVQRQQDKAWNQIKIALPIQSIVDTHGPELSVFEQMWPPTEADISSWYNQLQAQVTQYNQWEIDVKTLNGLLHMAAYGQFPQSLLSQPSRLIKPGSTEPDITFTQAKDPEATLSTLLSIVMHPQVLNNLCKQNLEARLVPVLDKASLSNSQLISIALKDSPVLEHIKGDWDSIRNLALQELLSHIRPMHHLSGLEPNLETKKADKTNDKTGDNLAL